ncbi:MAG TPA: hypothetical protein VGM76_11000 [Lacipirellulaceae bacterium]
MLPRIVGVFGVLGIAIIGVVGCRPADQIQTYSVPKEVRPVAATEAASSETADRMLAAILPDGDKAWFLKLVAPVDAVVAQEPAINEFFASVRPAPDKPHPDWKLPEGWEERAGNGMRAATIVIPTSTKPLEISVTSLPWTGTPDETLVNVNRWRGQMQLAEIGPQGLAECTHEITAGDAKLTIVDLQGHMKSGGMSPPFAGGGPFSGGAPFVGRDRDKSGTTANIPAGHPPIAGGAADLPAGHPPLDNATEKAAQHNDSPLTYKAPESWHEKPLTAMRKASFSIADGAQVADVSVIDFPTAAGPMMADPLANVNRWRGEVGLPQVTQKELTQCTESIEIDGKQATFVDAVPDTSKPDQSQADQGTLAAMLKSGDTIWFVKMKGSRDLVAAQRDQFKAFLKSVRFSAAGGAHDGN